MPVFVAGKIVVVRMIVVAGMIVVAENIVVVRLGLGLRLRLGLGRRSVCQREVLVGSGDGLDELVFAEALLHVGGEARQAGGVGVAVQQELVVTLDDYVVGFGALQNGLGDAQPCHAAGQGCAPGLVAAGVEGAMQATG